MIDADWQRAAGKGDSRYTRPIRHANTLIAAGPDFKRGETNDLASGNVDLAPTILQILGIKTVTKNGWQNFVRSHDRCDPFRTTRNQENRSYKTFPIRNVAAMASNLARWSTIYLDEGNGPLLRIEPAANESQRNR